MTISPIMGKWSFSFFSPHHGDYIEKAASMARPLQEIPLFIMETEC